MKLSRIIIVWIVNGKLVASSVRENLSQEGNIFEWLKSERSFHHPQDSFHHCLAEKQRVKRVLGNEAIAQQQSQDALFFNVSLITRTGGASSDHDHRIPLARYKQQTRINVH